MHTALADGVRAHTNVFFNIIYIRELKRAPLGLLYNIHINTLFPCCRCKRSGVFEWRKDTCSMPVMLRLLWMGDWLSSSTPGATKLNPLKSWWALALGGIPGESGTNKKVNWVPVDCCDYNIYLHHTPRGVLAVNSESKYIVSSGLWMTGLKGGAISFLNNF